MSILLIHPTGNQNVRYTLRGLHDEGILHGFATCIATFEGDYIADFVSILRRRRYDSDLKKITHLFPIRESLRNLSVILRFEDLIRHERGIFSVDNVYYDLDKKASKLVNNDSVNAVYGYDGGCLESFKTSSKLGKKNIYDLPTGYWRANIELLKNEAERYPAYLSTLPSLKDSQEKLEKKDEEIEMSDLILVASEFTKNTLSLHPAQIMDKVRVVRYGFPFCSPDIVEGKNNKNKRVKLLFVGKLSHQKGLGYLFDAMKGLEKYISLTVIGGKVANCKEIDKNLTKYEWLPYLSHDDLLVKMAEFDALIFPSLFDGFGLVITEAMSQGLPVIATERSGAPDIVEHGIDGLIMKAGSVDEIKNVLEKVLQGEYSLEEMGKAAKKKASMYSWDGYKYEIARVVKEFISNE